ncbi:hypothetical protein P8452_27198 [Trifolium repens]|nr:hypothetical protein P8452_27198 [Trifolium repens]
MIKFRVIRWPNKLGCIAAALAVGTVSGAPKVNYNLRACHCLRDQNKPTLMACPDLALNYMVMLSQQRERANNR